MSNSSDSQIILVSPGAHYAAHNWPNTVALFRALRSKGQAVRVVTFSVTSGPVPADLQGTVEPVCARMPPIWKQFTEGNWPERRLAKVIIACETLACLFTAMRVRRRCPDAVLHFVGGSYWVVVLAVLWFKRVHFVQSLYGSILSGPAAGFKARLRAYLKNLLQRAAATKRLEFTCETEFLHEEIKPLLGPHIHLIPAAIDDSGVFPTQDEARRNLGLDPKEKILLFFGTHRREKDYYTALKGCLALPDPPLALFVGKVISENDPARVVEDCRYPKARIVDKFIDEAESRFYFAAADAVALPYEANYTRGSQVLIECCRSVRPMIASASPHLSAFITRYGCGLTYKPEDFDSFRETTMRLLANTSVFQAGLERARHEHSWVVLADQYIGLYRRNIRV